MTLTKATTRRKKPTSDAFDEFLARMDVENGGGPVGRGVALVSA